MKKNFNNQNFEWLFQDITSSMPKIIKRRRRKIIVKNANEEAPKNFKRNITSFQLSLF